MDLSLILFLIGVLGFGLLIIRSYAIFSNKKIPNIFVCLGISIIVSILLILPFKVICTIMSMHYLSPIIAGISALIGYIIKHCYFNKDEIN